MGIEAQGKMVEQVDLDDNKEDKATNEVVDDVKKVAMEGVDKERKHTLLPASLKKCRLGGVEVLSFE